MLRKKRLWVCLTALTLCLGGVALGKALKHELLSEDGVVLGKAKLNYAKGAKKTECQVNCWDLEPKTEYIVLLCECYGDEVSDCMELGTLTTNKKGKGHLHTHVEGDVWNWCVVVGVIDGDILRLSSSGPSAGDTLEGVADWWLEYTPGGRW